MQEAPRLMGKKLPGLPGHGRQVLFGRSASHQREDDILMAMARELVTKQGNGERADAVWATLQKQQEDILGTRAKEDQRLVARDRAGFDSSRPVVD